MVKRINPTQVLLNKFVIGDIRLENSKFDKSILDGDIMEEKLIGFTRML